MTVDDVLTNEALRLDAFPVARERVYLGHAGVAPICGAAAEAIRAYAERASRNHQEVGENWKKVGETRDAAAQLLGCDKEEIALMGPTSLGLSLIANGLEWEEGDEVVSYHGDYPANVYPWMHLARKGVRYVALEPEAPGVITWDVVEAALTERTRLVSLATCHFLSGYRIDVETVGRKLQERGILFCLDGIQTVGAFPIALEYVDFLCADSHKWLLGPCGAGIMYVKKSRQDMVMPTLLGAWNVVAPDYVAQDEIAFHEGARRYEPGTHNIPGILGMGAAMEMLLDVGVGNVAARILSLRDRIAREMAELGYELFVEESGRDPHQSGIVTFRAPDRRFRDMFSELLREEIVTTLRKTPDGEELLRFSPHFYNTDAELDRTFDVLSKAMSKA